MKRVGIVALACLNVALLAALLWGVGAEQARGQGGFAEADYLLVSGDLSGSAGQAVYVVDLGSQQLIGLEFDRTGKYRTVGYANLQRDFDRILKAAEGAKP